MNKICISLLVVSVSYGLVNTTVALGAEPNLFPGSAINKGANSNSAFSKPREDEKPYKDNTMKKIEDKVKNVPIGGDFSNGKKTLHYKGKY